MRGNPLRRRSRSMARAGVGSCALRRGVALTPALEGLESRALLSTDVLTYHYDRALDGQDTAETVLNPSNVNSASFGKKFSLATDGYVYAQPLLKTGVAIPNQGTHD